jgi:hypothetical protein
MAKRASNSWPFSSRQKVTKGKTVRRSSMTVGQSMKAAREAGRKSGDTGQFKSWLESSGLAGHGALLRGRLQREYVAGVESNFDKPAELNREFLKREALKPVSYKGRKIEPVGDGEWVIPLMDHDSRFDSLADAKRFIDSWNKANPKNGVVDNRELTQQLFERFHVTPKFQLIANEYFSKVESTFGAERVYIEWTRKGTDQAFAALGENGAVLLKVHVPASPHHLYSFLHEIGHAMLGHLGSDLPENQEEYEAAAYAIDAMQKNSVPVSATELREIRRAIAKSIRADERRGVPIDPRAAAFAAGESSNPGGNDVTDRAKRYRAQKKVSGPKVCVLCGSKKNLDVMHLSGNEDDGEPANLAYGCRSCNGKLAAAFKRIGAGRPTNQYNPAKSAVPSFEQYAWAVSNHTRGAHDEGGVIIHATPKHKRIEYARRIAGIKTARGRERDDERWNPLQVSKTGQAYVILSSSAPGVPRQKVPVKTGDHASAVVTRYIDSYGLGGSNWTGGDIVDGHGTLIARVSYNGRIWAPDGSLLQEAAGRTISAFEEARQRMMRKGNPHDAQLIRQAESARSVEELGRLHAWAVAEKDSALLEAVEKRAAALGISHAKLKAAKPRAWNKKNPRPSAQALYESFHGKPATEELVIEETVHHHEHLAVLGRAVECWIETPTGLLAHIQFDQDDDAEPIFVCSAEDGKQLYFEGGDQSIDLAALKMDGDEWLKDRMVLGQFAEPEPRDKGKDRRKHNLTYHTKKDFDNFDPIDYQHDLGEETGVRPYLEYDPRNQHLFVSGGQYHIEQPMFETSPGIEN